MNCKCTQLVLKSDQVEIQIVEEKPKIQKRREHQAMNYNNKQDTYTTHVSQIKYGISIEMEKSIALAQQQQQMLSIYIVMHVNVIMCELVSFSDRT